MHNKSVKWDETTFTLKNVRNQVIQTYIAHFSIVFNFNKVLLPFTESNTLFFQFFIFILPPYFFRFLSQIPVSSFSDTYKYAEFMKFVTLFSFHPSCVKTKGISLPHLKELHPSTFMISLITTNFFLPSP